MELLSYVQKKLVEFDSNELLQSKKMDDDEFVMIQSPKECDVQLNGKRMISSDSSSYCAVEALTPTSSTPSPSSMTASYVVVNADAEAAGMTVAQTMNGTSVVTPMKKSIGSSRGSIPNAEDDSNTFFTPNPNRQSNNAFESSLPGTVLGTATVSKEDLSLFKTPETSMKTRGSGKLMTSGNLGNGFDNSSTPVTSSDNLSGLGNVQGIDPGVSGGAVGSGMAPVTTGRISGSPIAARKGTDASRTPNAGDGMQGLKGVGTVCVAPSLLCKICDNDNASKKDQLVLCENKENKVGCNCWYHTTCVNVKRIPFSSRTKKDRDNRDKYMLKYFSNWKCPACVAAPAVVPPSVSPPVPSFSTANMPSSGVQGIANASYETSALPPSPRNISSVRPRSISPVPRGSNGAGGLNGTANRAFQTPTRSPPRPPRQGQGQGQGQASTPLAETSSAHVIRGHGLTKDSPSGSGLIPLPPAGTTPNVTESPLANSDSKQAQAAKLMSLLTTSGITIESLLKMGEAEQRSMLVAAAAKLSGGDENGNSEGGQAAISSTVDSTGSQLQVNSTTSSNIVNNSTVSSLSLIHI